MSEKILPLAIEKPALSGTSKALLIGDVFFGTVTLEPEVSDLLPGFVETLKQGSLEWGDGRLLQHEVKSNEKGTITHRFAFTCYKPMTCRFPAITFQNKSGETIVSTESITMEYVGVELPQEEEMPIYGPMPFQLPIHIFLGLIFLILCLLGVTIWLTAKAYIRFKRSTKNKSDADLPLPPFEEFMFILKELGTKDYLKREQYKPYYFTISEGLKRYLGRKLQFNAEELTTSELIHSLNNRYAFDSENKNEWKNIFNELDLVKFTDQKPNKDDAQTLMQRCLELVKKAERIPNDLSKS